MEKEILKSWEHQTADTLYVLLKVEKLFPEVLNDEVLKKTLGSTTLISGDNIKPILNILIVRTWTFFKFFSYRCVFTECFHYFNIEAPSL